MRAYLRAYWAFVVVPLVAVLALVVVPAQVIMWRQARAAEAEAAASAPATLEASSMADGWLVEGAGNPDANGVYLPAGTHNGATYYTNSNGWYLFLVTEMIGPPLIQSWLLGPTLLDSDHVYMGTPGETALPANPWVCDDDVGGAEPAPTVSEYTAPEEEPEHFGTREVTPSPVNVTVARMEWIEVGGDDCLFLLTKKTTNEMQLLRYDLADDVWDTDLAAVPTALRLASLIDTCTANGRFYVAACPGTENEFSLWEYDPATDTWTARVDGETWDDGISSEWGTVYHDLLRLYYHTAQAKFVLAANGWRVYYPAGGSGVADRTPFFERRTVDATTWAPGWLQSSIWRYTTSPDILREDIAWNDAIELFIFRDSAYGVGLPYDAAQGYASGGPGPWVWPGIGGSDKANMRILGAVLPDLGTDGYYYAIGQPWEAGRLKRVAFSEPLPRFAATQHQPKTAGACTIFDLAGLRDRLFVLAEYSSLGTARLLELDLRPQATNVTVQESGADVVVSWVFDDGDLPGDAQTAYQVIVTTEGGTEVYDSTKTTSTASSHTVSGLANNTYIAKVTVWDVDDLASPPATRAFLFGEVAPDDTPPTVEITAPTGGATITQETTVTVAASDDRGVAAVSVYVDGNLLKTLTAPNAGSDYSVTWSLVGYAKGTHTITAVAVDNAGQTASDSITVTLDTSADTTDPTVTINSPAASATVSGEVAVSATCTDDIAVVRVRLYVDGQLQDTLTAPNDGTDYALTWDSAGWANGNRVLRVTATDAAGNIGFAQRTVILNRSKALATKYLFLKQQPQAELADRWRSGLMIEEVVCAAIPREEPPADEHERYQVYAGIHVPGDSVDFDKYQLVRTNRVNTLLTPGPSFRFALKAVPSLTVAYWELDATAPLRLIDVPGEPGPMVLTEGDPGLWQLGAGGYTLAAAVDMTSPVDAAYLDGQILVAGDELHVVDLDTGDLTWEARLPAATGYTALGSPPASVGGTSALVGVETATGHLLYSFAYSSLRQVAAVDAEIARIVYDATGQVAGIGLTDGTVQRWAGGTTLTELMDTGAAVASALLDLSGGVIYVGTGTDGEVWYRNAGGDVSLDATLAAGTVRAMTRWNSRLYATGLGDGALWRREGDVAGWAQWYLFDDVTDIADLYVDAASRLWVAATHADGARIYRLEAETGGDFECGELIPDLFCGVVKAHVESV